MKWFEHMSQAIKYIEENLTDEIDYDEISKIACCSTYYFKRMFSYITGITLSDYIRRRRMSKAAFELLTSKTKIIDIGLKYGYTSPTSFNRAFQSIHGIAPKKVRREGITLNLYSPISFSINIIGGEGMKYRIEKKGPIRIVGLRVKLEEEMEKNFKIVPKFWDKTVNSKHFSKISDMVNDYPHGVLGVTVYKNPDDIHYYIAASTDKPVKEMFEYEIPSATWAIFEADGRFPESVQKTFNRFLMEWLPFSGYKYAELPDIEVYPVSNQKLKGGHSEVWIAVKKES
ncbi:MAG: AraC family transcriptional regulator [Clostridiales bacterium]